MFFFFFLFFFLWVCVVVLMIGSHLIDMVVVGFVVFVVAVVGCLVNGVVGGVGVVACACLVSRKTTWVW